MTNLTKEEIDKRIARIQKDAEAHLVDEDIKQLISDIIDTIVPDTGLTLHTSEGKIENLTSIDVIHQNKEKLGL